MAVPMFVPYGIRSPLLVMRCNEDLAGGFECGVVRRRLVDCGARLRNRRGLNLRTRGASANARTCVYMLNVRVKESAERANHESSRVQPEPRRTWMSVVLRWLRTAVRLCRVSCCATLTFASLLVALHLAFRSPATAEPFLPSATSTASNLATKPQDPAANSFTRVRVSSGYQFRRTRCLATVQLAQEAEFSSARYETAENIDEVSVEAVPVELSIPIIGLDDQVRVCGRLLASIFCGMVIGVERRTAKATAGVRTLCLVSLGSAIFTLSASLSPHGDPARMAAQIATGVGFIGAGCMQGNSSTHRGLTTAASIWIAAALGVANASGLHVLGVVGAMLTVLILRYANIERYTLVHKGDKVPIKRPSSTHSKAVLHLTKHPPQPMAQNTHPLQAQTQQTQDSSELWVPRRNKLEESPPSSVLESVDTSSQSNRGDEVLEELRTRLEILSSRSRKPPSAPPPGSTPSTPPQSASDTEE